MSEIIKPIKTDVIEKMNKTIEALNNDLSSLRTGRASGAMLNSIKVDYYGNMVPIEQVATVGVGDARTLLINIWDKSVVVAVEAALRGSNLGLNPVIEGTKMRIVLPAPTEESRKKLVKQTGEYSEKAKIAIRHIRKEFLDKLKDLQKAKSITEDDFDLASKHFEDDTKSFIAKVDETIAKKSKEIMEL